jgi:hypothetical protein
LSFCQRNLGPHAPLIACKVWRATVTPHVLMRGRRSDPRRRTRHRTSHYLSSICTRCAHQKPWRAMGNSQEQWGRCIRKAMTLGDKRKGMGLRVGCVFSDALHDENKADSSLCWGGMRSVSYRKVKKGELAHVSLINHYTQRDASTRTELPAAG